MHGHLARIDSVKDFPRLQALLPRLYERASTAADSSQRISRASQGRNPATANPLPPLFWLGTKEVDRVAEPICP